MDRPLTIQFPAFDYEPDRESYFKAAFALSPFPGIAYVEMAPYSEKIGGVYLPETVAQRTRADVGVVLARGKARDPNDKTDRGDICATPPEPGTIVGLMPYKGDAYKGFRAGAYRPKGKIVRVFGNASTERRFCLTDWNDSIMFELDGKIIRPLGKWALLRRDNLTNSQGGIMLQAGTRNGKAHIVALGETARTYGAEIGRCHYRQAAITVDTDFAEDFLKATDSAYSGDPNDYCFIKAPDLLAMVDE